MGDGTINLNYPEGVRYPFDIKNKHDIIIEGLTFTGWQGVRMGFWVENSSRITFRDTKFYNFTGVQAIVFLRYNDNVNLENIYVNMSEHLTVPDSPHTAVYFNYGNKDSSLVDSKIYGTRSDDNTYCVALDNLNDVIGNSGIIIDNNILKHCTWGIHSEGQLYNKYTNNHIENVTYGIETGRGNQFLDVSGNTVVYCSDAVRTSDAKVDDSLLFNYVKFTKNTFANCTYAGMQIRYNTTNFFVRDNTFINMPIGVTIQNNASSLYFKQNDFFNVTTILNAGANTSYILFEDNDYFGGLFTVNSPTAFVRKNNDLSNLESPYWGNYTYTNTTKQYTTWTCYTQDCTHNITYNGTHMVIQ